MASSVLEIWLLLSPPTLWLRIWFYQIYYENDYSSRHFSSLPTVITLMPPSSPSPYTFCHCKNKTKNAYCHFRGFQKGAKMDACVQPSFTPQSWVQAVSNILFCFIFCFSYCFLSVSLLLERKCHRGRVFPCFVHRCILSIKVGPGLQLLNE